ncbi:hypothetical protein NQ317_014267 [Molorchus minor]|uniref:Thaumatin-like protein n=1 Tax=Molorchus minor TaxID=1323400 RepID=A0ABQ9JJU0_9CUCU|nr:hypothetical protein NQ317_014267 [Molorchus minor]
MFKLIAVAVLLTEAHAVEFQFVNNEIGAVWVGIQGNPDKENLADGGFVLEAGAVTSVQAAEDWAGRFWARTYCDASSNHCLTGDCGDRLQCQGNGGAPPASLAEITLKGADGLDFYDLSLVDGFNIRIAFEPVDGTGDGGEYSCKKATCNYYFNDDCPEALRLTSDAGVVVGCKSACLAFDTDQYCCRNSYGTPDTCKSSDWPTDYPSYFKAQCPDAYSYAYDDHKSTFTYATSSALELRTLDANDDWSGHFWARTWCNEDNNHCLTGDCGNKISCSSADFTPPVTTVELSFGETDQYYISLASGFNILAEIYPVDGNGDCSSASCQSRINKDCPDALKVDTEHGVLACKSACVAFDTDEYCCRNDYASADSCRSDSWPNSYGTFFGDRCPNANLSPYDSHATYTCRADTYEINFGG